MYILGRRDFRSELSHDECPFFLPGCPDQMIILEQIRAARGLLGWSQRELAIAADVPVTAIKTVEGGRDIRVSVMAAIEKALTEAGVLFLDSGDTRDGGPGLRFRRHDR
jgi:transcriptional regulator with XRE-family HTH domain